MKQKILLYFVFYFIATPLFAQNIAHRGQGHYIGRKGSRIETQRFNRREMLREDSINARYRVGGMRFAKKFEVDLTPENSGELFVNADGSSVWKLAIKSDSAFSINLLFSQFQLAELDTVFIYNKEKTNIVCLTENNNLKSNILPIAPIDGDEITVEYRQSNIISNERNLRISDINHAYIDFRGLPNPGSSTEDNCSLHASCDPVSATIKQSTCLLIINGNILCSGSLVNNTAQDGKPYVLTAAHCFGENVNDATKISRAPSIVAFFNYEAPNCTPAVRGSMEFSIGGSTMRALATDIDMALVELSSIPPADFRPYYAGWNRSITPIPTGPYRGIHHPNGTVKRVAISNNSIKTISKSGFLANCFWDLSSWTTGTTANGSSGSGLFDASGKLIGSLTGGNSYCGNGKSDQYSQIGKSWNYYSDASKQLKAWLDPLNSGATAIDGFDLYHAAPAARLSNIEYNETVNKSYLATPNTGLAAGQNSLGGKEYAELYSLTEDAFVYGVYAVTGIANADVYRTSPNKITISVYSKNSNNLPGELLGSKTIDLSILQWNSANGFYRTAKNILTGNENYIRFNTPIKTGADFFIAYNVPYTNLPTDSFAVYTAKDRTGSPAQTSFVKQNDNTWVSMYNFSGLQTALWLDPVVCSISYTGTNDAKKDNATHFSKIYPNPATDYLHIDFEESPPQGAIVSIFDCIGKKVLSKQLTDQQNTIELQNLYSGVYFVQIKSKNNKETHKIVVK
jgi:hypothetical protein